MGNSIGSRLYCHEGLRERRFWDGAEPRTRRSEGPEPSLTLDHAEVAVEEADDVTAAFKLGDANPLTYQTLADSAWR
jgi:hypothetical protein